MDNMAAIVFDVRNAERRLKAAGASDELAEATADIMSEAFVFNVDALVTKDYLETSLDARFAQQDARLDPCFANIDAHFSGIDARCVTLEARLKGEFRLIHALLAILMAGVFLPQVQNWLS